MQKQQSNFMDGKTWIAILLVMGIWFAWQSHMSNKYGNEVAPTTPAATAAVPQTTSTDTIATQGAPVAPTPSPTNVNEQVLTFDDSIWSFGISNKGMGLQNFVFKNYKNRKSESAGLAQGLGQSTFETKLLGLSEPLIFDIKREGNEFVGTASAGSVKLEKRVRVDSSKYLLDVTVKVEGMQANVRGVSTSLVDRIDETPATSMFAPAVEHFSVYVGFGTSHLRENLTHDKSGKFVETQQNVSIASVGSLYFAQAITDNSEIHPEFQGVYAKAESGQLAQGSVDYVFPSGLSGTTLNFKAFAGPKEIALLTAIDPRLEKIVDYWVLGAIAKPMLKLMQHLHGFFGNWGLAIIFLTLIVRTLVMPLYLQSFKSMKAMQKIQPQMTSIREKYKENPQQLNAEVMKLFKDNKVNPLGGCLPMLLQFPVFIALYRVLSQSIELYQAPFMLWIHDLSLKDPYYVLPVLMGISMFVQQKITPTTTADPAQQKVLMFMPVLFSFMMMSLPSGLTLYIFVSTLFGIIQQFVFMRDKKSTKTATAKA